MTKAAWVATNATITHWMLCRSASKSSVIDGSATFSEVSKAAKNMPRVAAAATNNLVLVMVSLSRGRVIGTGFYPF